LSNRGGATQVYVLPESGDDAVALTADPFGVTDFQWSRDGRQIAYLATANDDLQRLWCVDVDSKATRELAFAGYRIDEFRWQDSTHLLVAATQHPRLEQHTNRIYRVSTTAGDIKLVANPPQPFDSLQISPDGRQFAVRSTRVAGPIPRDIFIGPVGEGVLQDVSNTLGLTIADLKWHDQNVLWALAVDGFYNRVYRLARGVAPLRIETSMSIATFDVAREGLLAFVGEDFTHLPEIYLRNLRGEVRQLSHLQQGGMGIDLTPAEIFRTPSPDGWMIEAALLKSPGSQRSLVLWVHAGPAANFCAGYGWETAGAQFLAAHGYQVLLVNPRGSDGYSEDFVKANRGDWGGGDYRDLMTVLDAVIARGGTDPERLGIGGWSYGGQMAAWAITQSRRFKAAVVDAGVFDQASEFMTEDDPVDDAWYLGNPWDHPDVFARNSPSTYIRAARTPTLILVGQNDTVNPIGQSQGLRRALEHFDVPAEMVVYPGEGHALRRLDHNVDRLERVLSWYDRYLLKH